MDSAWAAAAGTMLTSLMFLFTMFREHFPHFIHGYLFRYTSKVTRFFSPYIHIKFPEQSGERLKLNEAYANVRSYLVSACSSSARSLKAEIGRDSDKLDLSMDDYEEVTDVFKGVKVWWTSNSVPLRTMSFSWYPSTDEKRYYQLTFHRRHREMISKEYMEYVMEEGRANQIRKRQRKLYTNNTKEGFSFSYSKKDWSHVPFDHPATFATIAMEPNKKKEIIDDLYTFSRSKDYYKKIGKVWKRGYLLYGPPGTGKSSMVAAMANLLDYDVYDLELTAVKNNTALRKLLIETTSKAVIVIEDIDCSLDLTGKRKKAEEDAGEKKEEGEEPKTPIPKDKEESKVTLSGLLNFIDGLWSACGGEKIIVFTTNHVEKLDQALIRKGRMDKHIELSYCGFEAFKVLAGNYLGIANHTLFPKVEELMKEVKITPADVAECLMPKGTKGSDEEAVAGCLEELLRLMEETKQKAIDDDRIRLMEKAIQEEKAEEVIEKKDPLMEKAIKEEKTEEVVEKKDTSSVET